MQTKNKATTMLITAILILSFLATVQPASAVLAVAGLPATVNVGEEVTIDVTGTTPGGLVRLYWDTVKAWDGTAGLIAETYAVGTSASIKIKIPEAVQGLHYVVAKDVESGATAYATTTVLSKIELVPDKAIAGDTISVSGTGFAGSASAIVLYGPTETSVIGEAVGTGDGVKTIFYLVNKPVKPGSVTVYLGGISTTAYTLNPVTGAIIFTTAPGLAVVVTADYTYYAATPKVSTTTSSVGSFSASLTVPSGATPGPITIRALDSKGNEATATLQIVTSIISLSPEKGYIDSTVTVTGRGFTGGETVDIRWLISTVYITVVDDYPIKSDGSFSTTFKVPLVPDPTAPGVDYTVQAIDTAAKTATATFKVVAPAKITLSPKQGKVDAIITIAGEWFTENKKVTFKFAAATLTTDPSPVYTDSYGSFAVTFKVPSVAVGTYTVTATDEEGVSATAKFDVIVLVIVIETRATTYLQGDTVSISAKSSEIQAGLVLKITDPDGMTFWKQTGVNIDKEVDGWYVPSLYMSVQLPSDAPLGSWNFTAWNTAEDEILDTNLFTVAERPTLVTVLTAVDELQDSLETVKTKLDEVDAAIAAMEFPEVQDDLDTIISELAALTEIKTALAKLPDIEALAQSAVNAASEASDSSTAAKTASESAQATASGISIAVYGAVILSLIAALASIVAVITLQRKVAG